MQTKYSTKDIARFWGYIDKNKSTNFYNGSRCWEWVGHCSPLGYGRFQHSFQHTYKVLLSHRVSYELTCGEIPKGLGILHHCDNPPCCNPKHLFPGNQQDNVDDMMKKGRHNDLRGERSPAHKLTHAQVVEIRQRYARGGVGGETGTELAKAFGISDTQIYAILNYEKWKT